MPGIVWLNLVPHPCTPLYSTPFPPAGLGLCDISNVDPTPAACQHLVYSCPDHLPVLPNYNLTRAVGLAHELTPFAPPKKTLEPYSNFLKLRTCL